MDTPSTGPRLMPIYVALVVLSIGLIASLALHVVTWLTAQQVRLQARAAVEQLRGELQGAAQQQLSFSIPIQQTVPISVVVPVQRTITVPIDTVVPIDTEVTIAIPTPLGEQRFALPIQASVPVQKDVVVTIDEQIPVTTQVEVAFNAPVVIDFGDAAFDGLWRAVGERLDALLAQL